MGAWRSTPLCQALAARNLFSHPPIFFDHSSQVRRRVGGLGRDAGGASTLLSRCRTGYGENGERGRGVRGRRKAEIPMKKDEWGVSRTARTGDLRLICGRNERAALMGFLRSRAVRSAGPSAILEIFGSGNFWCGALHGLSRDRGRGSCRLRGGSRPTRRRGAGRRSPSAAPHRALRVFRGPQFRFSDNRSVPLFFRPSPPCASDAPVCGGNFGHR